MPEVITKIADTIEQQAFPEVTLKLIKEFEKNISKYEQVEAPLVHRYLDGIYSREIYLKKGMLLTSKTHKTENLSVISTGKVIELTEEHGVRELKAPLTMISPAGVKRALYVLEDTVWTTVHKNETNEKDLIKLEDMIIEPDLETAGRIEK